MTPDHQLALERPTEPQSHETAPESVPWPNGLLDPVIGMFATSVAIAVEGVR